MLLATTTAVRSAFGHSWSGVLNTADLSLKNILWAIFTVVFIVYVITTLVLLFHWRQYGMGTKRIVAAKIIYFFVSIIIIAVALFSLFFI